MVQIHKITELQFPFRRVRSFNSEIVQFIRSEFERTPCELCDAVQISSEVRACCEGFQDTVGEHLSNPMPLEIQRPIEEFIANERSNFLRSLNRDRRPVIYHAKLHHRTQPPQPYFSLGLFMRLILIDNSSHPFIQYSKSRPTIPRSKYWQ
jgi:hypothetical protein